MKHQLQAALLFAISAIHVSTAVAQLPEKSSYLEKIFGFNWAADRATLVGQLQSRPKIKKEKDFEGNPLFSGGDLLGHPAAWWGLKFFGDRLIRVDVKLQAPGDANKFYEEWQKKIGKLLGINGTVGREGDRRISTWRTTTGGPAGKGELVVLQTIPKEPLINLFVYDADLAKPK